MGSSPIQGLTATAVVEEGSIVAGAATNAVLYVNSSGQLATEAAFGYNDSTNTLTVDTLTVAVGPITLSSGQFLAPDGTAAAPSYAFSSQATGLYYTASQLNFAINGVSEFAMAGGYLRMSSDILLGWASGAAESTAQDTILLRDAANVLAQRNGTNAQQTNIYNTFTSSTNYERLEILWASNVCNIWTDNGSGGGTVRDLVLGTNATAHLTLTATTGNLTFAPTASSSGVASHFTYTGPADTGMTASTESIGINFNASATRTWAAGALTLNREVIIQAPTYAITGGASTISDAVTFAVSGPPIAAGSPATTITRSWIATFGTLEATTSTPTNGVGVFGAGRAEVVVRDATNNIEGVFHAGASVCGIGSATNHDIAFMTANTIRWSLTAATNGGLVASGNYRFSHGASALATTATEGYFHMNSCAGAPTGVPASIPTGQIPMVIDSTNSRIYAYIGGAWKSVAVA